MSFDKLAKQLNNYLDLDPARFPQGELVTILHTSLYNTGLITPVEFSAALNLQKELTRLSEAVNEVFQDFDKDPRFADATGDMAQARELLKGARAKVKKLTEKYCEENK